MVKHDFRITLLSAGRRNPSSILPEFHDDGILDNISTAEVLLSTGSLQTDNLLNTSFVSTNQQICQELEKEQNNHQLTLQNLQITQINLERANRQIEIGKEKIREARKEIFALQSTNIPLSPPGTPEKDRNKVFAKTLETAACQIYLRCHDKTKETKVFSMLKDSSVFDCKEYFLKEQKAELTKMSRDIFRPWKLRKKCDKCDQGGINASGCGQIQEVQDLQR